MATTAQPLLAPSGNNAFLDALSQVSGIVTNTAGSILTTGGTFLDKLTAYKIALSQNVANPVYTPTSPSNDTTATTLTKVLVGAGVVGAVGLIAWTIFKK
jgi:hypothetical protein